MGGDARRPHIVQDVDFADRTRRRKPFDEELELVAGKVAGRLHRLLVKRGIDQPVDCAVAHGVDELGEDGENFPAGLG